MAQSCSWGNQISVKKNDGWGWDGGCQGYGDGGRGCMEPGQEMDVELHEGRYWNVGLCTGIGGSGGVGSTVGVIVTDGVGSGGSVGGGCGDSDAAGSIGGSWLCGSVFWVAYWGFCGGGGAGGSGTGIVV